MAGSCASADARRGNGHAQGRLMRLVHFLTRRNARPAFLYPGELSPHLLRDIGLGDAEPGCRRPRS